VAAPKGFVWDEAKRRRNLRKHGVDFADLPAVFSRPRLIEFDAEHSEDEDRWRLIGLLGSSVVVVIYREHEEEIRIISARHANREETRVYYGNCFGEFSD
jgi:uncharacterized protein